LSYKLPSANDIADRRIVMERRYRVRLEELLADAEVPVGLLRGVQPRLVEFLQPYVQELASPEQRTNTQHYVRGLLSDLGSKDIESIAYLHDRERQGLQKFIGQSEWDYQPLLTTLVQQVGTELAEADAVLVFDPSAFPKKGTESVGVQRQWCGRLGKLDNCQVGIYLAYVSRREHALVDFRLYLPAEWARRPKRRHKAGVPRAVRFRTRHELILDMLDERGPLLPHGWISGDDELGRSSWFRGELRSRQECYLLAVPSNTLVRDLRTPEPPYSGRGRRPSLPFVRVERWSAGLPSTAWQTIEVRDGEKGPVVVEVAWTLVQARTEGQPSAVAELLLVFRERQGDGSWKHDYLLSNADLSTPLAEFARVFKAQHRIEECLQRAKGEAGMADYQVRTWQGWHHHQTLSLLAAWFLTQETRRGKKVDAGVDRAATGGVDRQAAESSAGELPCGAQSAHRATLAQTQRGGQAVPLEASQPLATAAV
jgi:SRSO17 transposase